MPETVGTVVSNSSLSFGNIFSSVDSGLLVKLLLMFFILIWILAIIWVAKDIMSRSNKLSLQLFSLLVVSFLTPIIGLPIYFVIRPIGHKHDKLPRRESAVMNLVVCYNCATLNPKEHHYCLACGESLKIKCKQCNKEYPHSYEYCNFCGAPNID